MNFDEEALLCDLAETYHIYDYEQLSLDKIAVFSIGLRDSSRIKMKMSDQTTSFDTMLLAGIKDALSILVWFKTKDGQKGTNRPKMVTELLTKKEVKPKRNHSFHSGEEFEKYRNKLFASGGD